MSRVGVLTFHYSNSYGAALQAYGLCKAIEGMGHSVEMIDYRPLPARRAYGRWPRHPLRFIPSVVTRYRFSQFRRRYLPLSPHVYLTAGDLRRDTPQIDRVVCGSDQIWNVASFRGFDPVFFADFPASDVQRISYAATFGFAEDFGEYRSDVQRLLSRFDCLSVRDHKSRRLVHDLTGRWAEHVLDPSFLAHYDTITPPRVYSRSYILVYCLKVTRGDFYVRAIQRLSERLRTPVVCVDRLIPLRGCRYVRTAGPLQWLSLIRHADYVCTSSFHGICFSLINKKQFVAFPVKQGNSRLEDILQMTGLSHRRLSGEDQLEA